MSDHADVIRQALDRASQYDEELRPLDAHLLIALVARIEELEVRDKMRDDGEHHLLGEVEARDARVEELEAALREILRHTGGSNAWHPGDGCRARRDGEGHENCRPVIFDIARAALGGGS